MNRHEGGRDGHTQREYPSLLSEEQIDRVIDRLYEICIHDEAFMGYLAKYVADEQDRRMYEKLGRKVVSKVLYLIGTGLVALASWIASLKWGHS